MMSSTEVGKRIVNYRSMCNFSTEELAYRINVSIEELMKWENGISYPDIIYLYKLADVLGISIDTLVSADENEMERLKSMIAKTQINDSEVVALVQILLERYMDLESDGKSVVPFQEVAPLGSNLAERCRHYFNESQLILLGKSGFGFITDKCYLELFSPDSFNRYKSIMDIFNDELSMKIIVLLYKTDLLTRGDIHNLLFSSERTIECTLEKLSKDNIVSKIYVDNSPEPLYRISRTKKVPIGMIVYILMHMVAEISEYGVRATWNTPRMQKDV